MNNIIEICDSRCGKNWHRFCARTDCQYFDQMLIESDKTKTQMFFGTIGDKQND